MFALGTALTGADLRRVLRHPRPFVIGLAAHTLILPLIAFAMGLALPNLFTHLARGDTMLSVTLTAAASLLSALTLPALVKLALLLFGEASGPTRLPLLPSALGLFLIATAPVLAGMSLRGARPAAAARVEARLSTAGMLFVLVVIATTVWSLRATVGPALARAGGPALLLNLSAVSLGWGVSALAGLGWPQRLAVGLECGLQNFALAAFVCLTLLQRPALLLPAIAYGLTMWISAIAIVAVARRRPLPA
jgi:BASS family bile acid:Na+ symporter